MEDNQNMINDMFKRWKDDKLKPIEPIDIISLWVNRDHVLPPQTIQVAISNPKYFRMNGEIIYQPFVEGTLFNTLNITGP
jgi:hypothetical protein